MRSSSSTCVQRSNHDTHNLNTAHTQNEKFIHYNAHITNIKKLTAAQRDQYSFRSASNQYISNLFFFNIYVCVRSSLYFNSTRLIMTCLLQLPNFNTCCFIFFVLFLNLDSILYSQTKKNK